MNYKNQIEKLIAFIGKKAKVTGSALGKAGIKGIAIARSKRHSRIRSTAKPRGQFGE